MSILTNELKRLTYEEIQSRYTVPFSTLCHVKARLNMLITVVRHIVNLLNPERLENTHEETKQVAPIPSIKLKSYRIRSAQFF